MAEEMEKLSKLLKRQFDESKESNKKRVERWEEYYRAWRGLFKSDDDLQATSQGRRLFDYSTDLQVSPNSYRASSAPTVFIRETYLHVETVLARIDEAFTAPKEPFKLVPQRVVPAAEMIAKVQQYLSSPEDQEGAERMRKDLMQRKQRLDGVSKFLTYDYRMHGSKEEHLEAFRDALVFGTGWTYHRAYEQVISTPRAVIERIPPWRVFPDPFHKRAEDLDYVFIERFVSIEVAKQRWPDSAEKITGSVKEKQEDVDGGPSLSSSYDRKLKAIKIYEVIGRYDLQAIEGVEEEGEAALTGEPKLMRIYVLGNESGPSSTILQTEDIPYSHKSVPLQEYTFLRSPVEQGPFGISLAELVDDTQQSINAYFNLMLMAFGFGTLTGGYYDAAYDSGLSKAFAQGTPGPGEWMPVDTGGRPLKEILWRPEYPNYFGEFAKMYETMRGISPRLTGVTDMTAGISTKTYSDTLGEVNALQKEGNTKFRFVSERLDSKFLRSIHLHVATFKDALTVASQSGNAGLVYFDEHDEPCVIDAETMEQPFDVHILAGSSWIDEKYEALELLQLAQLIINAGAPDMALPILRTVAMKKGLDPDEMPVLKQPEPPPPAPGLPGDPAQDPGMAGAGAALPPPPGGEGAPPMDPGGMPPMA